MTMNRHNAEVLDRLRSSVISGRAGGADLDGIQSALQSAMQLFENDGSSLAELARLAEADVEEIRFTRLLEEQPAAVFSRLEEFLRAATCDEHR